MLCRLTVETFSVVETKGFQHQQVRAEIVESYSHPTLDGLQGPGGQRCGRSLEITLVPPVRIDLVLEVVELEDGTFTVRDAQFAPKPE